MTVLRGIKRLGTTALLLCAALPCGGAQLSLMPWPSQITQQDGALALNAAPRIELTGGDERVQNATQRFLRHLAMRTGAPFDRHFAGALEGPALVIHCAGDGRRVQALDEDESYHLSVSQTGIQLTAANPLGIMHGLETLLQLVEPGPREGAEPLPERLDGR